MWYLYFLRTPLFFNLIVVLMVIIEGSEVEAKRKTSFIEFFSTGRHHVILIQLLILTTILWEKYYHLNFAKTKGKAEEIIYISPRDTASWKDRIPIQGLTIFFSIKGQRINIFECVGHMVSVAVIHLCGFITEAAIGLPWWLSGKEFACQFRRQGFNPWLRKIPHVIVQLNLYTTTIESVL